MAAGVGAGASLALGVPAAWLEWNKAGNEGWAVCSFVSPGGICGGAGPGGLHVAMSGAANASRGSLYAVYHYLEKLGFQFLAPDETVVPAVSFVAARATGNPPQFEYREANSISHSLELWPEPLARQKWAIRNRYNAIPEAPGIPSPVKSEGVYATPRE